MYIVHGITDTSKKSTPGKKITPPPEVALVTNVRFAEPLTNTLVTKSKAQSQIVARESIQRS